MQSIQGENAVRQTQIFHQGLGRGDFIGFDGNRFMGQDDALLRRKHAEDLHGGLVMEMVKTSPQDLAIAAHQTARGGGGIHQLRTVAPKTSFQLLRRGALNNVPNGRVCGTPFPAQIKGFIQGNIVPNDELLDFSIRSSTTQNCQDGKEENMTLLVTLPLRTAVIFDFKQKTA